MPIVRQGLDLLLENQVKRGIARIKIQAIPILDSGCVFLPAP